MAIQAQSADGVMHEFPDGTSTDVISKVMKDYATKQSKGSVTSTDKAKPSGSPRWDVLGDIGRAAEGSFDALKGDIKGANAAAPGADLGPVGTIKRMGSALKAPLDALGVAASPITGTAHALLGSAVAAGLDKAPIPGHDPKADADSLIDQASLALAPETMGATAGAISTAAKSANTLKKVANLAPGAAEAHAAGYVLPPTSALEKPGVVNSLASGVGGKIKLQQGASTRNQEVTNGLAAQSLGLPKDTVLTDKVIKVVRDNASKAYGDIANSIPQMQTDKAFKDGIAKLSTRSGNVASDFEGIADNPELDKMVENMGKVDTFKPDSALFVVRKLRKDASANLQNRADPSKAEFGLAQRKAADELDDLVERNLVIAGKADLVPKYKLARQTLAKSHDVEGATNTATGDVSAKALARLSNRGRPFTGELKVIADTANAFPKAMQNTAAFGGDEPYSALDAGATAFAAAHGDYGAVATILGRPIVRNALLSKTYQDRMIPDLTNLPPIPSPQSGLSLVSNAPLPGVQNQLAKGIFRAAHVNGLRTLTMPQALSQPPSQGQ